MLKSLWEQLVGSSFHQPLRKPESRAFRERVGGDRGARGLKNICLTTLVTSWGPHPILVVQPGGVPYVPDRKVLSPRSLSHFLPLSSPPTSPECSSTAYKAQLDQRLRLSIVGSLGTQASSRWAQLCHGYPCQAPGQTDTGRLPLQLSLGKGVAKLGKGMDGLTGWLPGSAPLAGLHKPAVTHAHRPNSVPAQLNPKSSSSRCCPSLLLLPGFRPQHMSEAAALGATQAWKMHPHLSPSYFVPLLGRPRVTIQTSM